MIKLTLPRVFILICLYIYYSVMFFKDFFIHPELLYLHTLTNYIASISVFLVVCLSSAIILILPRKILLFLGGLIGLLSIHFSYCYFYNPFITTECKLYTHPQNLYQLEYPAFWEIEESSYRKDSIYFQEPKQDEKNQYRWDYANNSIEVNHYSQKEYLSLFKNTSPILPRYQEKGTINLNGQKCDVFFGRDGGSSFSGAYAAIHIPYKKENDEQIFVIEVDRTWCADGWGEIANPHGIPPQRLLKKALPIIETFKLKEETTT